MKAPTNIRNDAVIRRYVDFCGAVKSTLSQLALDAVKRQDFKQLKKLQPCASDYSDATSFALDWQVYSYLRKFPGLPGITDKERRDVALASWSAGESRCFHTNERIKAVFSGDCELLDSCLTSIGSGADISLARVIALAQVKIEKVLGPFNWKVATAECRWSGGATADQPRGTQLSKKMTEKMTVTKRALPHLRSVIRRDPGWMSAITGRETFNYASPLDCNFEVIDHNRFLTVPKTAFTDRCIAAEPTGNTFLQQGVGKYIRRRLKRFGVDLDDQSWNQNLALKAYAHGFSTIDLEGASDSVSLQLVKLLLPPRWFEYLADLRSPFSRFTGDGRPRRVHLQKFSSMGNAFTFELETLIFWSVSKVLSEHFGFNRESVGVYGDDIVVKRAVAPAVIEVLNWMGFKVNTEKTFLDGNFFESCGGNYFMGEDVTGFCQSKEICNAAEVISYYNRHVRWSMRIFGELYSPYIRKSIQGLYDERYAMPASDPSDFGFIVSRSELAHLRFDPNHGYKCRGFAYVQRREAQYKQRAFLAYKLRKPENLNDDPKGHPLVGSGTGTWISTYRWIHRLGFN